MNDKEKVALSTFKEDFKKMKSYSPIAERWIEGLEEENMLLRVQLEEAVVGCEMAAKFLFFKSIALDDLENELRAILSRIQ